MNSRQCKSEIFFHPLHQVAQGFIAHLVRLDAEVDQDAAQLPGNLAPGEGAGWPFQVVPGVGQPFGDLKASIQIFFFCRRRS